MVTTNKEDQNQQKTLQNVTRLEHKYSWNRALAIKL